MEISEKTSAAVVNLTRFGLENHVARAFRIAWQLSEGRPINAGHLLRAGLLAGRKHQSSAFNQLAAILSSVTVSEPSPGAIAPAELGALPFTNALARSFSVAEGFLHNPGSIWGRDYITIALLAVSDPSLVEIAQEASLNVETLQLNWFSFVSASSLRRPVESWHKWWQAAGVELPGTARQFTGEPAYLLTWNPAQDAGPELDKAIKQIEETGSSEIEWPIGSRRNVALGARVFLFRQGTEPLGLVGMGQVSGEATPGKNRNPKAKGKTVFYANIRWEHLAREPVVTLQQLVEATGEQRLWSTQIGGVRIRPNVLEKMSHLWQQARRQREQSMDFVPELEARQWIARFSPDTGRKDDQLRIDRYVDAFARVIAAQSLTPPLSIGLFGDWGSGKTFFMDLLNERIEELCGESNPDESHLYLNHICQIRFNAWHYAETNLWASLVSHIFNSLRVYVDGEKEEADDFNQLLNKLEVAGELRRQAQIKLDRAKKKHRQAQARVRKVEKALSEQPEKPKLSDDELRKLLASGAKKALESHAVDFPAILGNLGNLLHREDLEEAAQKFDHNTGTVKEARILLEQTKAFSSRAGFWWRILCVSKLHKSSGFWIIILLLLAIPLLATIAVKEFGFAQNWAHLWTFVGQVLAASGAVITWMRSRLASASGMFVQLDAVQAAIEREIEDARSADRNSYYEKRDKALADEKNTQQELKDALRERDKAAEAERDAEQALRDSTSQARFTRFIRDRASSADYARHLGIVAMVHRDFEQLSKLMIEQRDSEENDDLPTIERIVLYVDDLDRCRPEKVVQVLEAIHLLLFFPLFVVVVGVDSRWVSRALYRHYGDMLADESMQDGKTQPNAGRAPADSQDYLEKIFQVPFWLRRMESAAVERLIHSLIPSDEVEKSMDEFDSPESVTPPNESEGREQELLFGANHEDKYRAEAKTITVEAESQQENLGEPLAPPTESLTITESEMEYMSAISPLMPRTPRSVKRFVNIYRIYKAALSTPALARFLGTPERPGNFRVVQVLLALVTGAPRFAQAVFSELYKEEMLTSRLSDLVKALDGHDDTWRTTLDALRDFAKGDNDLKLAELRQVSALVGRYSVHHMVSELPGEAGLG